MVKPPRVRHSKTQRDPVTIDLEPGDVSRISEPSDTPGSADDAGVPSEPVMTAAPSETVEAAVASVPSDEPATASADSTDTPAETTPEAKPEPVTEKTEDKPQERPAFGRDAPRSTPGVSRSTPPPPRPAPEPKPRGSGSALLYAIVGGIVAVAIGWGLLQAGVVQVGGGASAPDDGALSALQAEVAGLKGEVDALKQAPAPEGVAGLQQAIDDSNARVAEFGTALETLRGDLATLRQAVESGGAGDGAAVQALATRVGEIEAAVAALGQGSGTGEGTTDPAALDALGKRIDTMETALQAAATAASATDGRIAQLEQSLADLARQVENIGGQPKVALAIASAALRAALERGGIFTAEVETFAAVAPPETDLTALRDVAAKGVATRAQLATEMPGAADAMIAAANTTAEDPGFFGGIVDGIGSLVTVRPIGEVPGPGVPETVARMEVAVQQGDLAKAMAEYDTLSEPAKAAGAALADKIRTRIAAEQLVDKALADALKGT